MKWLAHILSQGTKCRTTILPIREIEGNDMTAPLSVFPKHFKNTTEVLDFPKIVSYISSTLDYR